MRMKTKCKKGEGEGDEEEDGRTGTGTGSEEGQEEKEGKREQVPYLVCQLEVSQETELMEQKNSKVLCPKCQRSKHQVETS